MKLPDQRGFPVLVPVVLKDRPTGRFLSKRIEQTETGTDLIPLEFPHCMAAYSFQFQMFPIQKETFLGIYMVIAQT